MNTNIKQILDNPCFRYIDDIAEISAQSFKGLSLHFFGHISVYPDGRYSFLCSDRDWPAVHFANQKIPPVGFAILNPMVILRKYSDHYEEFFFDLHSKNVKGGDSI